MEIIVIVGAGHCGGRAALALREAGWAGSVVLVGDEDEAPYERPALSKGLLRGEAFTAYLASAGHYAQAGITWLPGRRVQAIDRAARQLRLDDGASLVYDRLLLATGGRARTLALPGADLPGVHALRSLPDARRLAGCLGPGAQVVIVGGGFIGLEVAASARALGASASVVEAGPRLLGRAVPAAWAARVQALHEAHGVAVALGVAPVAFERRGHQLAVHLADGRVLPADTILVGIGLQPEVGLAREAGLACANGIEVDAHLRTADERIFAAGDVAAFPAPRSGRLVRLESWHNAEDHARVAATNLAGGEATVTPWPWFWSDQYDHQLQLAGDLAAGATVVGRPLDDGAAIDFHLDARGALAGLAGFGPLGALAKEFKLARMLLERGVPVDPVLLADPSTRLKSLLRA